MFFTVFFIILQQVMIIYCLINLKKYEKRYTTLESCHSCLPDIHVWGGRCNGC